MFKLFRRFFETHKTKNQDGYVLKITTFKCVRYEHRVVAEQILGRELKYDEVVHHIDGVRSNNKPENLCVLIDHAHQHFHRWYRWRIANNTAPSRPSQLYKLRGLNGIVLEDLINKKSKRA